MTIWYQIASTVISLIPSRSVFELLAVGVVNTTGTVNATGTGIAQFANDIISVSFSTIMPSIFQWVIATVCGGIIYVFFKQNRDFKQQFLHVKYASKISLGDFGFSKNIESYYLKRRSPEGDDHLDDQTFHRIIQGNDVLIVGKADSGKTRMAYQVIKNLKGNYILLIPKTGIYDVSNLKLPLFFPFIRNPKFILFLDDLQRYCASTCMDDLTSKIQSRFPVTIIATVRDGTEYTQMSGSELLKNSNRFSALLSKNAHFHIPDVSDEEVNIIRETEKEIPEGFNTVRTMGIIFSGWDKLEGIYETKIKSSGDNVAQNAHKIMIANRTLYDLGVSKTDEVRINTVLSTCYGTQLEKPKIIESENLLRSDHIIGWDPNGEWLEGGKILDNLVSDPFDENIILSNLDPIFELFRDNKDSIGLWEIGVKLHLRERLEFSSKAFSHAIKISDVPELIQAILYTSWGNALGDLARHRYPEDAAAGTQLFNDAFEKYNQAVLIKQDMHEAWNNWGSALADLAQLRYPEDAAAGTQLFNDAFEKYNQAVSIKPDKHEAWYNWGVTLKILESILSPEHEISQQFLAEGIDNFKRKWNELRL